MALRSLLADTRPLRNPHFRRLWSANIITVIGAQMTLVAVPAQLYSMTGSSAYVGLSGVFGLVPLLIFGLWGGALADAFDRRKLLIGTVIGIIVTSGLFFVWTAMGNTNVWIVLITFSAQQAFFAANQPARIAILPELLPNNQLPAANALNMTVVSAGGIAGPLVGGALIPVLGFQWLYFADVFFLLPTLLAFIGLPSLEPEGVEKGKVVGWRSVVEGLVYLAGHKILLASFLVDLVAMIFGLPRALFPQIAHESFGSEMDGGLAFGILYAAIPFGAALGGVFSGWVSRIQRQGRAVILAIVAWGLSMTGFGIAVYFATGAPDHWLWIGAFFLVLGGAADMASAAFRQTMLLTAASDNVRARLQGVFFVVVSGGPRIADIAHGAAAVYVGTAVATGGGGILVVLLMLLCALLVPAFTRYRVEVTPD
ncbi:MAG: MFS transporter [Flaviflexus sp.]|uniref:MFS transporter n=1 Tax=Flaviflexus sp. TaxID=1969482 RepID=UPI003F93CE93